MPVDDLPGPVSKRDRLLVGARRAFYLAGVERTTLADVAEASGVPVGNVYYYFKTKDELVSAAVVSFDDDLRAILARAERKRMPRRVSKRSSMKWAALATAWRTTGACSGRSLRSWTNMQAQFHPRRAGGSWSRSSSGPSCSSGCGSARGARARDPSHRRIRRCRTALTHSLRDPQLLRREVRRMQRWIDGLSDA